MEANAPYLRAPFCVFGILYKEETRQSISLLFLVMPSQSQGKKHHLFYRITNQGEPFMKIAKFILMVSALLLSSCGTTTNGNQGGGTLKEADEEATVINYLKKNGVYQSGEYHISVPSKIADWDVLDSIAYNTNRREFSAITSMTYSKTVGAVMNLGVISFKWGYFTDGVKVGGTTYTVGTSVYQNSFSFDVSFGKYPSFQITTYRKMSVQMESSVSDDAVMCASCLERAMNTMIKSAPSMGAWNNLW